MEKVEVASIEDQMIEPCLGWFGHVTRPTNGFVRRCDLVEDTRGEEG